MIDFKQIEAKWQKKWVEEGTFNTTNDNSKEKYYILTEFPYPSGTGLHIGHPRSYTALDTVARMKRMQGLNILFPMGWDAFGAPAEQYAIKNKIHPKEAVEENVKTFRRQLQDLGLSFDWSREFSTTDPEYYKWTQWQFLKFFEHGLAYKAKKNINWCEKCKTGLSNEDSAGGVCERCGDKVTQKEKEQWLLKMTEYAEDLLEGLKDTDYDEKIKTAQINWIGKSVGVDVKFEIKSNNKTIDDLTVFTTRADTLFGATFMVVAPEHPITLNHQKEIKNIDEIKAYQKAATYKTELERTQLNKEKTGVEIEGITAINPANNEEIPIYISDYVMMNYGTGAIMAVPAHDERDFEFASKYNIPIKQVIAPSYVAEDNPPIEGKENTKRNVVMVVITNKDKTKYLALDWVKEGWKSFVAGGVEEGEDIKEAALREALEESGYKNIIIDYISNFYYKDKFYASHKDLNRDIIAHVAYAHIEDDELLERNEEEKKLHNIVWLDKKEVLNFMNKPVKECIEWFYEGEKPWIGDGEIINSDFINGLNKEDAINKMIEWLEAKKLGSKKVNYKLQDWIFSRQRFWGEPIPLIYCEKCDWVPVPEAELPVLLPEVTEYEPTDDGESPLAKIDEWVNTTCPICNAPAKRETDTMPNWAGSSWYWLRYMDPKNTKEFASQEALKYWGQVDWYNGGMEHATRHLLYARFWNQFLYNIGLVPYKEPFKIRVAHGMILAPDGQKFAKSKGNGVSPDEVIAEYGADALRLYMCFIGDYEKDVSWNNEGPKGTRKFLDRVARLFDKVNDNENYTNEFIVNKTIKKVTYDIENMKYNTAVSSLMIMLNELEKQEAVSKADYITFLQLLNPIAPHLTEELNEKLGGIPISQMNWPEYDDTKIIEETITIGIQVNGKVRGSIEVNDDMAEEEVKDLAQNEENVKKHLVGKEIKKIIYINKKIVSIVTN